MNKRGQEVDIEAILKLALIAIIVLPLLGVIFAEMGSLFPHAPACDYTPYQSNISTCYNIVNNLTSQLNQTPVKYIQNITYVPVEKPGP